MLERIKQTGEIFMAWGDRPWVLDGAAVRVSMVGFDSKKETNFTLDGKQVQSINSDLTSNIDLTKAKRLKENLYICFMGPSAKAPFDISEEIAKPMLNSPININGRPNSDVVKPLLNASDLVQISRRKWTIDFGLMSYEEAIEYEMPFQYVKDVVLPVRQKGRRDDYRGKWWQYARPRPEMREALKDKERYIATPAVSKHRIFVWVNHDVLCNQRNLIFARDDDYFMGILHSKLHELWALNTGSTLEDRPCYTPTTTFETYPFPWSPGKEPAGDARMEAIAQAARDLVEKRERWLKPEGISETERKKRTLTNLYNQRPDWLTIAHQKLDRAVLDAYSWPHNLSDEEILEQLLALNLERAARQGTPLPVPNEAETDEDL